MENKEPEQTKGKRKFNIKMLVLGVSCAVFVFASVMLLVDGVILPMRNQAVLDDYRDLLNQPVILPGTSEPVTSGTTSGGEEIQVDNLRAEDGTLLKFQALLNANKDFAGWIKVPNSSLDHPVFYTPDDQDYYLKKNPNGEYDKYGSLYMSAGSTLNPQAQAMVIYGHNMEDDDLMFGQLTKYLKSDFLAQNPYFTYDTIYNTGEWKIISVCYASADYEKNGFYYPRNSFSSEEQFNKFIWQCRIRSLYYIEDDVSYDDSLLILSTCGGRFWGERIVVVARKVREDEKVDIENYKFEKNTVNFLPLEYYETYKKTRPSSKDIIAKYCQFYGEDKFYLAATI